MRRRDASGVTLDRRTLSLAAAGCASYSVSLSTAGAPAGSRSITARAAPVAGETATADNARTVTDATGNCRLHSGYLATSSMTFTLSDVSSAPGGAALTYDPSADVATSVFIKHP